MTETVIVLSWDAASHVLKYLPVDAGNGGAVTSIVVARDSGPAVTAECEKHSLPRVGVLVGADDAGDPRRGSGEFRHVLLELSGPAATECVARWKRPDIVFRRRSDRLQMAKLPPAEVGLPDLDLAVHAENIGSYYLFDTAQAPAGDGLQGCWECPGGLSGWAESQRARREQRRADRAEREAAKQSEAAAKQAEAEADKRFINPYTFVRFPAAIERSCPAGHHLLGRDRLSGAFRARFAFTSPMQAPDGAVSGERLRLPGSSVKGAVRSLHETLAGGCLRVFDENFVPSYRDTANVPSPQWTLAVVEKVTRDQQPLKVRLCDRVVWVRAEQLCAAWGGQLATGSRVSFDAPEAPTSLGRHELGAKATVERDGPWVVLLGARRPETRLNSYFAACGRVGGDDDVRTVPESAWREFRRAVAGATEVLENRQAKRDDRDDREFVPVRFGDKEVGCRKRVTGRFDVGDVLWVKRSDDRRTVEGLKLAAIWRHSGAGSLRERVPEHLHACPGGEFELCPSCRLFGAADTRTRAADKEARQRSYAGHVRFGDAVSPEPVELTSFRRAPMGAPRPGAGQFYLRYDNTAAAVAKEQPPTREWGAVPDQREIRMVRGRKHYWHADPSKQAVPRHIARDHQTNERMGSDRQLAAPGTVLEATITFDNLSAAELGGLLATLDPALVLPREAPGTRPLRLHLGGGKPLGLGSCQANVSDLRVWSAESRYGDADPVVPDAPSYVAAFLSAVPAEVIETWPSVAAVLAEDSVDATRVWYPPGLHWSQRAESDKAAKQFDEPFAFFVGTSGMYLATKGRENARALQPLPEPTDGDQSLRIIREENLDKGSDSR